MSTLAKEFLAKNEIYAWNTGRGYSQHGQRIAAVKLSNGKVYFFDIDRQIDGVTMMPMTGAYLNVQEFVMHAYDHQHYAYGTYDMKPILPHLGYDGLNAIKDGLHSAAFGVGGSEGQPVSQKKVKL